MDGRVPLPESSAQRYAPVSVIHSAGVTVLQVERVDHQSASQLVPVFHPQARAVEIRQQPLVGVHVERVGQVHAVHQRSELRAYERAARVGRVHVQPNRFELLTHDADFGDIVERTTGSCAQRGGDEKRNQPHRLVLFHHLRKRTNRPHPVPAKTAGTQ